MARRKAIAELRNLSLFADDLQRRLSNGGRLVPLDLPLLTLGSQDALRAVAELARVTR